MSGPFEGWTDEQVQHFAMTGERPAGVNPQTNRPFTSSEVVKDIKEKLLGPEVIEDHSQGMSGGELALAGAGMIPARLGRGISRLATMATLPSDPKTKEQILKDLNTRNQEANRIDANLLKNPEAIGGRILGEGLVAAAAPARPAAQVAIQAATGLAEPPSSDATGLTPELANRGRVGLERAATTAAVMAPMMGFGRAYGAAKGQYSPEGQAAMDLNASAKRLGINPTIRDLDPSSEIAGFEGQLFGRAREVENQLKAFNKAASETKDIPSASGASTTSRVLEGEKLRQAIVDAGDNLKTAGSKLWDDVDGYIVQNRVQPVVPQSAFTKAEDILKNFTPINKKGGYEFNKNAIFERIAYYDPEAAKKLMAMARAPKQAVSFGAPFKDFHEIQSAVGKAYGRAQRDMSAPNPPAETMQAYKELKELYSSMSQDVDNWFTTVAGKSGNTELQRVATKARDFWRDAVVPGTSGKIPSKARQGTWRQSPKGYSEARELYSDLASARSQMDELMPYMSQEQQDLLNTFSNMRDLQRVLISGQPHPPATGGAMLTNVGGMMLGSPLQLMKGTLGHTPLVKDLVRSNLGKRLYFSENTLRDSALGRVANALAQKPRWDLQEWERSVMDWE